MVAKLFGATFDKIKLFSIWVRTREGFLKIAVL